MIILIIFALFFGCSSNETLLHKINRLEKRLDKLERPKEWSGWIESQSATIISSEVVKPKFCHQCKELGLRSSIYVGITMATAMGISEYWDEDGNYHYDDPNYYTTEYSCSQGHNWAE